MRDYKCKIEHTGLKSATFGATTAEAQIFCDSDLLSSRNRNNKIFEVRFGNIVLGIHPKKHVLLLNKILAAVEEIVNAQKNTYTDRIHLE